MAVYRPTPFPYHQVATTAARTVGQSLLTAAKLLTSTPERDSQIIQATGALEQLILALHRDPEPLRVIDRRKFEELVAELFDGFGYHVELTARTRDGGKDIIAVGNKDLVQTKYLIECKRPDPGNVCGIGMVRALLGVLEDDPATKALLVATTRFSPDARALEQRHRWRLELKEFEQVLDWIARYVALKGSG